MNIGIDLGSRNVKIAYGSKEKFDLKIIETVLFYKKYGINNNGKFQIDLEKLFKFFLCLDYTDKNDFKIIATGYGRNTVCMNNIKTISEIKAHAKGAVFQTKKKNLLVIDIGGQDTKIIQVKNGEVTDFELNDNCAASTGRYLENMANVLDIKLEELFSYYKEPEHLSSTCAIFGESELIGKIAQGISIDRLCAGINYSIVKRIIPMTKRFEIKNICLVGGAGQNNAVKLLLKKELKTDIIIPQFSIYNGVIGALMVSGEW